MTLSTFLTFLSFLTRKLRWIPANQLDIRREALGRRLDAERTRTRAGWLKLLSTKTDGRAADFVRGANARKGGKVRKGVCGMILITFPTFPTFPTFLTQRAAGPEITSSGCRQRFGPPTIGPEADDLAGQGPHPGTRRRHVGTSRIGAVMPHGG